MQYFLAFKKNFKKEWDKINLGDVLFWVQIAWNGVSEKTITNCFNKCEKFLEIEHVNRFFLIKLKEENHDSLDKRILRFLESSDKTKVPSLEKEELALLEVSRVNVQKSKIFTIFRDLKAFSKEYAPSTLSNIYRVENEVLKETTPPECIEKYFGYE
jgi:hypothetical protein